MEKEIKVIAFDADDTLWVNETIFRDAEKQFINLLTDFAEKETISKKLFEIEMQNLDLYGYGLKSFILSMIEAACVISDNKVSNKVINQIIAMGKKLIDHPVQLLEGVETVLKSLEETDYKVIVATKGDLLDQERKLERSNLGKYFHHVEVMSEKKEANYLKLLKHLDISPEEFLMVGNAFKSDVLPVLNIGGSAVHVPFHTTWAHEVGNEQEAEKDFHSVEKITEILELLKV
jgi:putative hydrolase of the HAD superfamily